MSKRPERGVETNTHTQSFILLKSSFDPRQFWFGRAQIILTHRTKPHRLLGRDVSCCSSINFYFAILERVHCHRAERK